MRKQLLLFGASVATASGIALLTLSLVLTSTNLVYANTEAVTCSGACSKGGGLCVSLSCSNSDCGCPNEPNASGKCPCGKL